jgi:hypothetical protein
MRRLYENTPLVYIFDDHDAGSNNVDSNSKSIEEVNRVYQVRLGNLF